MTADHGEVITVTLRDVERDELHIRRALQYGATQQAKVRLVLGASASLTRLDDLIEIQLAHLGRTLGLLPPVIEVQSSGRLHPVEGRNDG